MLLGLPSSDSFQVASESFPSLMKVRALESSIITLSCPYLASAELRMGYWSQTRPIFNSDGGHLHLHLHLLLALSLSVVGASRVMEASVGVGEAQMTRS